MDSNKILSVCNSHHEKFLMKMPYHLKGSSFQVHNHRDGLTGLWWGDTEQSADTHAGITQGLEKETAFAS